jgi:hypothetical protein
MKKERLCFFTILFGVGTCLQAGTFIAAEGNSYDMDELQKISFSEDKVTAHLLNGETAVYDFSSLQRIYFTEKQETTFMNAAPNELELYLYPNPVMDKLFLRGLSGKTIILFIYDEQGRLIGQKECNSDEIEIDVSSFSDGIYFLKVNEKAVKFIKN